MVNLEPVRDDFLLDTLPMEPPMPGKTKTKPHPPEPTAEQLQRELRQQLSEQAARLRSLAAAGRERGKPPVLEEYVRAGRGSAYRRAEAEWFKTLDAIYAFEGAAARLEESLAYEPLTV